MVNILSVKYVRLRISQNHFVFIKRAAKTLLQVNAAESRCGKAMTWYLV
jgi:hypothetical protein